jgi:hypothetical protein
MPQGGSIATSEAISTLISRALSGDGVPIPNSINFTASQPNTNTKTYRISFTVAAPAGDPSGGSQGSTRKTELHRISVDKLFESDIFVLLEKSRPQALKIALATEAVSASVTSGFDPIIARDYAQVFAVGFSPDVLAAVEEDAIVTAVSPADAQTSSAPTTLTARLRDWLSDQLNLGSTTG